MNNSEWTIQIKYINSTPFYRCKQPQTNLTIWWWKRLTRSTLLSKFKNIDYITAYQSKSKQNNNNQTITKKKKSDYAYLKIETQS